MTIQTPTAASGVENQTLPDTREDQKNVTASTTQVVKRHSSCFAKGDLSGLMADYDSEASIFTTNGIVRGSSAIRQFFAALLQEFAKPGLSFERLREEIDGETAYFVWRAETADNHYEFATDTFVVRNGKIVTQTFAAKISPKQPPARDQSERHA